MERWAVKQIKGLAYNDLVASKTDRQTVKKLFKGESMRAVTLLNTLLNQILRESEHFFIHTERKKSCVLPFSVKEEWWGLVLITGHAVRRRAWYWGLVYWGILQNITCSHVSTLYLHNCAHKVISVASLIFPFWHFLGLICWCVVLGAFDIWATLIRLLWSSIQSH